ncbi:MAG: GNAT family N-acetyltransferase [Myxococcota bacterium]
MAREPLDNQSQPRLARNNLVALARCHELCLPDTASSRAGREVLEGLYEVLLQDPGARVIWRGSQNEASPHLGAFGAGSVRFRETEALIRRKLSKALFARLAVRVATMPLHVLSRRRFEHTIPDSAIGYVLTLGSASAVVPGCNAPRGSEILAELEDWFAARGARESWVDTELSNSRAHAFYLRKGYSEVARAFGQVLLKKPLA